MGFFGTLKRIFGFASVVLDVVTSPVGLPLMALFSPQVVGVLTLTSTLMRRLEDEASDNKEKDAKADAYVSQLLAERKLELKPRDVNYIKATALKMAKKELKIKKKPKVKLSKEAKKWA